MKKILCIFILSILFIIPTEVFALNEVNIYFFHKDTCDICEQERIYLQALKERYPNMRVYSYEINDKNNYDKMLEARNLFDDSRTGVPFTVVGDTPFHGFNQSTKAKIQKAVYELSTNKYNNKLGEKFGITYKTDLEGTVEEYKENSDYTIEEKGKGNHPVYKEETTTFKKYKASIILIGIGLILLIVFLILKISERRRYEW